MDVLNIGTLREHSANIPGILRAGCLAIHSANIPGILRAGCLAIQKNKITLRLNKPAYIGMCILDLSKSLMYKFHYDYIKNKYGNNSSPLFTDTDVYKILVTIKKCLIKCLIIQLSQNTIIIQANYSLAK